MTKYSETIDAAVAKTADNLRQERDAQVAREQRIHARDRSDQETIRVYTRNDREKNLQTGGVAVLAAAAVGATLAFGGGGEEQKSSERTPSAQEIQKSVEAQTQENEIHKALSEGKDPSEIVVSIPADVASGDQH